MNVQLPTRRDDVPAIHVRAAAVAHHDRVAMPINEPAANVVDLAVPRASASDDSVARAGRPQGGGEYLAVGYLVLAAVLDRDRVLQEAVDPNSARLEADRAMDGD